jgi:hypothetical protein
VRFRSRPDAIARVALTGALALWGRPVAGQYGAGARLLADAELWETSAGSALLARNEGRVAPLFRLQLFAEIRLPARLQILALGEVETGAATNEDGINGTVDLLVLRHMVSRAFVIEGGRFAHPAGAFAPRRFSNVNPLIGTPDGYPVVYPWGGQIQGVVSSFDYRVGLVSLPTSHAGYVPTPGPRMRPAGGIGFSPGPGMRFGVSATTGPYLRRELQGSLPPGSDWKDFKARVLAFDAQVALGYFESHAELAVSGYDAPTATESVNGLTFYLEGKYTWTPRFFTALRLEYNDYPFIRPAGGGAWVARTTRMLNGEVGAGYRFSPSLLVKASYRRDRWPPDLAAFLPNGYAAALQVSYQLDVQP